MPNRIGVDLGGSKIEAVAIDSDGRELARRRTPTPKGGYSEILDAVGSLVSIIEAEANATGASVGVGIPGALSLQSGLVKNANTTPLIGQPLDKDLGRILQRPVRLANDANCFALSEAVDGAGAGYRLVFGVILGSGTGGGISIGAQVHTGLNAIAGEWGHNPLPWADPDESPGAACYCGKRGCIETFLSGPGLAADFQAASGEELTAQGIAKAAQDGSQAARDALARYETRLAKALAMVINILDPDVIVLGGGLSNLPGLTTNVPKIWGRYCFSDEVTTPLVQNRHGDSSGVRGAAWLWP